jgi:hydrogenase maturation protease
MASGMIPCTVTRDPSASGTRLEGHLFEARGRRQNQHREVGRRRTFAPSRRILVLGAGNPLRSDGGTGTRAVETLQAFFEFSNNVTFVRDWSLCRGLLDALTRADAVVVIDAVRSGSRPGTLHTFRGDRSWRMLAGSGFPHQVRLAETLAVAEIVGRRPETVVVAIEPEDMSSWSAQLTETVELRIPDVAASALAEIERMGGECTPRGVQIQPAFACDLASA